MPDESFFPAPLRGLTVVEFGHSAAAPYAGMVLSELGARLVKIEREGHGDASRDWGPPYLDETATAFHAMNRSKQSVAVNLRNSEQADRLRHFILSDADIVIQNLRAGSVEEAGFGAAQLRAEKPSLIYCNLHAFGAKGPMRDKPGYDPLMQAYAGIMSVTGESGQRPPVRSGVSIVDMGSGMWAVIGILSALLERQGSGNGVIIDCSLYETAIAWTLMPLTGFLATGHMPVPQGSGMETIVPYQLFETADRPLMIAAGNDTLFRRLCEAIGHPELVEDPEFRTNGQRVRNREKLVPKLAAAFKTRPFSEWVARLDAAKVPNAPVNAVNEVAGHDQLAALDMIDRSADMPAPSVRLPLSFDGNRPAVRGPAPKLGADTAKILKDRTDHA